MHIEPGVVSAAKLPLSYATGAAVVSLTAVLAAKGVRVDGVGRSLLRCAAATAVTFFSFQVLPHHQAGVSEVHLILGSTLFLLFGAGPVGCGLALGLVLQGLFFAPQDLPQFGMNVTTLLAPLLSLSALAKHIIPKHARYVDLEYRQALQLSLLYQGGIVTWVTFWVVYGRGLTTETLVSLGAFGLAYASVVVIEPLVDLAVLAAAKAIRAPGAVPVLNERLWGAAQ